MTHPEQKPRFSNGNPLISRECCRLDETPEEMLRLREAEREAHPVPSYASLRQVAAFKLSNRCFAALSGDGRRLVTKAGWSSYDLEISDTTTGRTIRSIRTYGQVGCVGISACGDSIVGAGGERIARVWNALTGETIRTIPGKGGCVSEAFFSPDGLRLLILFDDGVARLWNVSTCAALFLGDESDSPSDAVFSPDGRCILTKVRGNRAKLWDAIDGREIRVFDGHEDTVTSAVFSPDGEYVLTASADGTAKMWDISSGEAIRTFGGHAGGVNHAVFSPDGSNVLSAGRGVARIWKASSGEALRSFETDGDVSYVTFSPDGRFFLTSGDYRDDTLRIRDVLSGESVFVRNGFGNAATARFSQRDCSLFLLNNIGNAELWTSPVFDFRLGEMYSFGKGVPQDSARSAKWYALGTVKQDSASLNALLSLSSDGVAEARYRLGGILFFGEGTEENREKGAELFALAAEAGHVGALRDLETIAEEGEPLSALHLARLYEGGKDVEKNLPQAADLYSVSAKGGESRGLSSLEALAEDGTAEARYLLGELLEKGECVEKDEERAVLNIRLAAEAGHAEAKELILGEPGERSPVFSFLMGDLCVGGYGVEMNREHAAKWYASAARKGYAPALAALESLVDKGTAEARYSLGKMLLAGTGVERNEKRAGDLLRLAAESGHREARYAFMGRMSDIGEHDDVVCSALFSSDGGSVLTASRDCTARLWNASTGVEIRVFGRHSAGVLSAVFSPDGESVLTAGADGVLKLWDRETGKNKHSVQEHTWDVFSMGNIYSAVFSPDGRFVLTASHDNFAKLWDASTMKEVRVFEGGYYVRHAVFSPDGGFVLTATEGKYASMCDTESGGEIRIFKGHEEDSWHVAFSPDGRNVLTASWDGTAKLWDASTGEEIRTLRGHRGDVHSAVFSPDGRVVMTTGEDGTIRFWDAATGEAIGSIEDAYTRSAAFSPDGAIVIAPHGRGVARWEFASLKRMRYRGDAAERRLPLAGGLLDFLRSVRARFSRTWVDKSTPAKFRQAFENNDEKAGERFLRAAERGDLDALCVVGAMHFKGALGVMMDARKTEECWRRAAERGHAISMVSLGELYSWGVPGVPKDEKKSLEWLLKAGRRGNVDAAVSLGLMYLGKPYSDIPEDLSEAAKWFRKAAEHGESRAQWQLALLCLRADPPDASQAAKWMSKAAAQGNARAQCALGRMFAEGDGVEKDDLKAEEWLLKAAENGNAEAMFFLGRMYALEERAVHDCRKGVQWLLKIPEKDTFHTGAMHCLVEAYRRLADLGDPEAQFRLACLISNGRFIRFDFEDAERLFRKADAQGYAGALQSMVDMYRSNIEWGSSELQYRFGTMLASGDGVERNVAEAVECFLKAANNGYAKAWFRLGEIFEAGNGVERDFTRAAEFFENAASTGDEEAAGKLVGLYGKSLGKSDPGAACRLGDLLAAGQGCERDEAGAVDMYRIAAEQGHAPAQCALGSMLKTGAGADHDEAEAVEWFRRSAEQGYAPAQFALADMLRTGTGVDRDEAEAVEWYRRSVEQEYAPARYALAEMISEGRGVERNEETAAKLFRKSAEQGYAPAQYALGKMCADGRGMEWDNARAAEWYEKSAEQGYAPAQSALGEMYATGRGVIRDKMKAAAWFEKASDQGCEEAREALGRLLS